MAPRTATRAALMSIRPEYAEAIMSGDKQIEFRKRPLAAETSVVVVYATMPTGTIIGAFSIAGQVHAAPRDLWRRYHEVGGIDRGAFDDYFADTAIGTGILIGHVVPLNQPLDLRDVASDLRPPQSYQYLRRSQLMRLGQAASWSRGMRHSDGLAHPRHLVAAADAPS